MFGNIGAAMLRPGSQLTGGSSPNSTGTNLQASSNPAGGLFGLLGAPKQGSGGAALGSPSGGFSFGNMGGIFGNPSQPPSPFGGGSVGTGFWQPGMGTAAPQGPAREWWWGAQGANTPLPGTPGGVGYRAPNMMQQPGVTTQAQPQNPFQNMHPGLAGLIQQIMAHQGGMGGMAGVMRPRLGIEMPQQAPRQGWAPLPSMQGQPFNPMRPGGNAFMGAY